MTALTKESYAELMTRKGFNSEFRRANLFVSHAWSYKFGDLVDAIKHYTLKNPAPEGGWFLWIDNITVSQHLEVKDSEFWSQGFKRVLESIGTALIVLDNWENPIWITRAWCLFEFWVILASEVQYSIILPAATEALFVESLKTEGNSFLDIASTINLENAVAFLKSDEEIIKRTVRESIGFAYLNESIIGRLREWNLHMARQAYESVPAPERHQSPLQLELAAMYDDLGHQHEALELCAERLRARPDDERALSLCGPVCLKLGDADEALRILGRLLALQEAAAAGEGPGGAESASAALAAADTRNDMALALDYLGRQDEALRLHEEALAAYAGALGPEHPRVADTRNNMGVIYKAQGRLGEALAAYEEALAINLRAHGAGHVAVADGRNNMAVVHQLQGRFEEARAGFEAALEVRARCLGPRHPTVAEAKNNVAVAMEKQGRLDEALAAYGEALSILQARCRAARPAPPWLIRDPSLQWARGSDSR